MYMNLHILLSLVVPVSVATTYLLHRVSVYYYSQVLIRLMMVSINLWSSTCCSTDTEDTRLYIQVCFGLPLHAREPCLNIITVITAQY